MHIDREEATATESFHGRPFYFCSGSCRDKFRANPERYANEESDKSPGSHHER
jgi:YHS domain-containing protein